jgi:hypothetical protein
MYIKQDALHSAEDSGSWFADNQNSQNTPVDGVDLIKPHLQTNIFRRSRQLPYHTFPILLVLP